MSSTPSFLCTYCPSKFNHLHHFRYHLRKIHNLRETQLPKNVRIKENTIVCNVCHKSFKEKRYLKEHMKRTHNTSLQEQRFTNNRCPICIEHITMRDLEHHLQKQHDILLKKEDLNFLTFEEFKSWKNSIEKQTKAKFTKLRTSTSAEKQYIYYSCHRSGEFITRSTGKRQLKRQGSNKINCVCPASIQCVKTDDDICHVSFIHNHIGHTNDFSRLPLTFEERSEIATKIASQIPFEAILDEVKNSLTDSGPERINLICRKDLYNIEKSFNLLHKPVKHKDDALSLDIWVKQMEEEDNCVLFFKPCYKTLAEYPSLKEEDFVLIIMNEGQKEMLKKFSDSICINGIHGVDGYGDQLFTLLALDEMQKGFPCAFMFSNRSDEAIMSIFFHKIKELVGVIKPSVFMSDMAESFYSAWMKEMGKPVKQLFCSWDIDHDWCSNLKKIKNNEKQVTAYKVLTTLLQEKDTESFSCMLQEAIKMFKNDDEFVDFGIYFEKFYGSNFESWAYCYRLHCDLNTNMNIEKIHHNIKYIYLNGKTVKRLDEVIFGLMTYVRDKLFDRLVLLNEGMLKKADEMSHIHKRHKTSLELVNSNVVMEDNQWLVSSSDGNSRYTVIDGNTSCNCPLVCTYCKVCIHRYNCTCLDSSIKWNMCKHIHLVCKFQQPNMTLSDIILSMTHNSGGSHYLNDDLVNDNHLEQTESIVIHATNERPPKDNFLKRKATILSQYIELINGIESYEELDFLEKNLKSIKLAFEAMKTFSSHAKNTTASGPSNKNIIPQRTVSKKRKRFEENTNTMKANKKYPLIKPNKRA